MAKKAQTLSALVITLVFMSCAWGYDDKSLFTSETTKSPLAQSVFAFLESNRDRVIDEWIRLTEIPAPSGHEVKRAVYMQDQFRNVGLEGVHIDTFGNVIGLWKGEPHGKKIRRRELEMILPV
jgi:tripeptide aminopeptidase